MQKHSYDFDYHIDQEVKILALDLCGHIDSLSLDRQGKMYRVVYWAKSERQAVWMYAWEIEKVLEQ